MAKAPKPNKFSSIVGNMMEQPAPVSTPQEQNKPPQAVNVFLDADVKQALDRLVLSRKLEGKHSNKAQVIEDALKLFYTTDPDAVRMLATK